MPPIWKLFRSAVDADALPIEHGDFKAKELGAATRAAELHLAIPQVYEILVPEVERSTTLALVFVPSTDMVDLTTQTLRGRYPSLTIHSWTGKSTTALARRHSEQHARAGLVHILVLCEMGGRAIDLPNASVLIDAYPSLSGTKIGQRHPRVTRRMRDGSKQWAAIAQIVPRSNRFRPVCLPDILDESAWEDSQRGRPLCTGTGDLGAPLLERARLLQQRIEEMKPRLSLEVIDELDLYRELSTEAYRNLKTWDERFDDLVAWQEGHPDAWPSMHSKDPTEKSLAIWLYNQRIALRDRKLTEEWRTKLVELGVMPSKSKEAN